MVVSVARRGPANTQLAGDSEPYLVPGRVAAGPPGAFHPIRSRFQPADRFIPLVFWRNGTTATASDSEPKTNWTCYVPFPYRFSCAQDPLSQSGQDSQPFGKLDVRQRIGDHESARGFDLGKIRSGSPRRPRSGFLPLYSFLSCGESNASIGRILKRTG